MKEGYIPKEKRKKILKGHKNITCNYSVHARPNLNHLLIPEQSQIVNCDITTN